MSPKLRCISNGLVDKTSHIEIKKKKTPPAPLKLRTAISPSLAPDILAN